MWKRLLTKLFSLIALVSFAQSEAVEMADAFRQEGKIYVVVAVILVLLIGLFVYLFRLEKTMKKLEEKVDEIEKE